MKKIKILVMLIIAGCCNNYNCNAQNILLDYSKTQHKSLMV